MQVEDHNLDIDTTDPIVIGALAACNRSYAPYTKAHAGIALRTTDGSIYFGRYAENAAYNPSLLAIQSALASMQIRASTAVGSSVAEAVLVERSKGIVSQQEVTRLILKAVSPGARLIYYEAGGYLLPSRAPQAG